MNRKRLKPSKCLNRDRATEEKTRRFILANERNREQNEGREQMGILNANIHSTKDPLTGF